MRSALRAILADSRTISAWRATASGLCASLVGIGLARFAYTPLIPALIAAGWFSPAQAAYLGAANLGGYLAGAWLAPAMAARASPPTVLRGMMMLATAAFFGCAVPLSFEWFFAWRFASGLAGGVLMVLAATTILPHISPSRRGLAGGLIFTGVGLGIAASGTLVPVLLREGLVATWCGLGVLALLLTLIAWGGWPGQGTTSPTRPRQSRKASRRPALTMLCLQYGLVAVGLVPHMVFLVDFVARGLGRGIDIGARYWIAFGLGAVVGPVLAGVAADRIGFAATIRLALVLLTVCVGVLAVSAAPVALGVSSAVVGACVPGIVPLVLGRAHELAVPDPQSRQAAWRLATIAFAVGQAGAAYGFSYAFAQTGGSYALLFALGAGALCLALVIDLDAAVVEIRRDREPWP